MPYEVLQMILFLPLSRFLLCCKVATKAKPEIVKNRFLAGGKEIFRRFAGETFKFFDKVRLVIKSSFIA